jgi:excisionase family DNA binding protein
MTRSAKQLKEDALAALRETRPQRETMTAKEAAALLGISTWLLYEMAKRKEVPHSKAGKRLLFRRQTLLAWLEQQEQASGAAEPEQGKIRRVK